MTVEKLIKELNNFPLGQEILISECGVTYQPILGILKKTDGSLLMIVGQGMKIGKGQPD